MTAFASGSWACSLRRQPDAPRRCEWAVAPLASLPLTRSSTLVRAPAPVNTRRTRRTHRALDSATSSDTPQLGDSTIPASSFNRGKVISKRPVGQWELAKLSLDSSTLVASEPPTRGLAITIPLAVVLVVAFIVQPVFQIDLELPITLFVGGIMLVWAVDALALSGALSAAGADKLRDRNRVAAHEAGHFLVGYLLGMDIECYALNLKEAKVLGMTTPGTKFGRRKGSSASAAMRSTLADDMARTNRALGPAVLGGVIAEVFTYGKAEGGADDFAELGRWMNGRGVGSDGGFRSQMELAVIKEKRGAVEAMRVADQGREERDRETRWCALQAAQLLKDHAVAHARLTEAMAESKPVEYCIAVLDRHVDQSRLVLG